MDITLNQVLSLVGELDDSPGDGTPRERFRRFLKEHVLEVEQIRDYIEECLRSSGDQYNRALQDLVNYVGHFLKFEIIFGRYKGVRGQIGFDGHWKSPNDDFHIVVEVKTTEAYAIKTATLIGYVDGLISEKKIPSWDEALGLYVIACPDPETRSLENSIVAEKRTDQLRIISVDSLLSLAEMMNEYDVNHEDILAVMKPSGPTIDSVVRLMARLAAGKPTDLGEKPLVPEAEVVSTGEVEVPPTVGKLSPITEDYTGKFISSFWFRGSTYEVHSWRELLSSLCSIIRDKHPNDVDQVLSVKGIKRLYFARNENQLTAPKRIPYTDIFVEMNLSARNITQVCRQLISKFGYSDEDLKVEVHESKVGDEVPKPSEYTIEGKFSGIYSDLRPIFDELEDRVKVLGEDVKTNVKKIHIAFVRKYSFAVLYPAKGGMHIGLSLDPSVKSDRLRDVTNWGWSRINKGISVSGVEDIDEQLIQWLKQSYDRS